MTETFHTTSAFAKKLGVSTKTVQLWCDQGLLAFTKTAGGHRRIADTELRKALLKKQQKNTIKRNDFVSKQGDAVKILIVDDDENLLLLYTHHLASWQDPVVKLSTATDAYQAMMMIGMDDYDLVITDLKMPGVDGSRMIKMIRENKLVPPEVVVVTALSKDEVARDYQLPENTQVYEKPISYALIKNIIHEYVQHKTTAG